MKKIWCHTFLGSHKFHKIVHYFSFEVLKKKISANFQRIIELFTPKIGTKLSKVWVWDPGVKKAPDPGSRSTTLARMQYTCRYPRHCTPRSGPAPLQQPTASQRSCTCSETDREKNQTMFHQFQVKKTSKSLFMLTVNQKKRLELCWQWFTEKKVKIFPVPNRDVTNQTPPGRD